MTCANCAESGNVFVIVAKQSVLCLSCFQRLMVSGRECDQQQAAIKRKRREVVRHETETTRP